MKRNKSTIDNEVAVSDGETVEKKKRKLKKWQIALIVVAAVIVAFVGTFGIMMGVISSQLKGTSDTEWGMQKYQASVDSGKTKEYYNVYTEAEIADNGTKTDVKLYCLPAENTTEKTKFVVICPGGAYFVAGAQSGEGFPVAATFAENGYTAFVLEYRTGDNSFSEDYSQVKDLAAAVKYIIANAESFNVLTDNYAVCGFSAGGHVVGLYGTDSVGYANYDAPKPSAVIMGYPLINVEHLQIEAKYVIGKKSTRQERAAVSTDCLITENYPATFFWQAKNDILFGNCKYSDRLDAALTENNVKHQYTVYKDGQHTCALGVGTSAEGWIYNAMTFWDACSAK